MTVEKKASPQRKSHLNQMVIAVTALAAVACLSACDQTERKLVGPTEKATIAYSTNHNAILADIAQMKGYFQQEGLDVTPRMHAYGKLALQDILEGKADFATVAETPVMFAILDGADISIIATIYKTNDDEAIVARTDKGIVTPGDLKGRKIAATFGTTTEFFLDAFLAINAIAKEDVELVNLRQEELPDALAAGKVDAVVAFKPYLIAAQKQMGKNGTTFHNKNIYTKTFNIVSTREFVKQNPGKVNKVLRALDKSEKFHDQNPEEALRITADFNKLDIAVTREMLDGTSVVLSLDQSLILALEDESRWAIKGGLTSAGKFPNYLDYVYLDGLNSVNPAAVEILK
jgi:NitT/TauT family transport system substrate-binding protein